MVFGFKKNFLFQEFVISFQQLFLYFFRFINFSKVFNEKLFCFMIKDKVYNTMKRYTCVGKDPDKRILTILKEKVQEKKKTT